MGVPREHLTVLVRCDVGPAYGVGHLMRCLALAEEFAARGHRPVFSADVSSVPFAVAQVEGRGFAHVAPPGPGPDAHVAQAAGLGADLVVVDSYHLPPEVYAALRAHRPTLALVDGDPGDRTADVLLDQNIGAEDDAWPLPDGTVRLAGLPFALMRDEVLDARAEGRPAGADEVLRVFSFFGGTDAFGAAPVVARALAATGVPFHLRVVGATERLRADLAEVAAAPGQVVEVLATTSALAREVRAADVVVSAAGSSSWELLCLGAACGMVAVADNQLASYARVTELGVVTGLGELAELREDPAATVPVLARLLTDRAEQRRLRAAGARLVDGRGRERVADALLALAR